jgi:hypothetical protein
VRVSADTESVEKDRGRDETVTKGVTVMREVIDGWTYETSHGIGCAECDGMACEARHAALESGRGVGFYGMSGHDAAAYEGNPPRCYAEFCRNTATVGVTDYGTATPGYHGKWGYCTQHAATYVH